MSSDEAVKAAAKALFERDTDENDGSRWFYERAAGTALYAAMPLIEANLRERIAQEIEAIDLLAINEHWRDGLAYAARVVRQLPPHD